MIYYTYIHRRNDSNQVFYVGKGTKKRAFSRCSRNRWWKHIVEKHGFTVEIHSDWETEQQAFEHEITLTKYYLDQGIQLVNVTLGGGGITGWKHSDEVRKKISDAGKNRTTTKQTRQKISHKLLGNKNGLGNKGNTTLGRPKLKGRKPWNWGLTKDTDPRIKNPYERQCNDRI